jgi:hypothetical protein
MIIRCQVNAQTSHNKKRNGDKKKWHRANKEAKEQNQRLYIIVLAEDASNR